MRGDSAHQLGPAAWLPGQGLATQHVLQSTQVTNIYTYILCELAHEGLSVFIKRWVALITHFLSEKKKNPLLETCVCASVADPHLLLCGSGSVIQKISIWIQILGGTD